MTRVKNGPAKLRRKRRLKKALKGFVGGNQLYRVGMERYRRALEFAFRDRKARKREFRALWITRISAAVEPHGLNYSRFIEGLKALNVEINRKMLSEMAIHDAAGFAALVEKAKTVVSMTGKSAAS